MDDRLFFRLWEPPREPIEKNGNISGLVWRVIAALFSLMVAGMVTASRLSNCPACARRRVLDLDTRTAVPARQAPDDVAKSMLYAIQFELG
ncbi:hypothetical protein ABZV68_06485, partial [Streptomyces clavifer]|uniref:hypothetical protein n=1 Tax=Streptomyces clavifer TaxID=68188 RepID=UPI00339EB963